MTFAFDNGDIGFLLASSAPNRTSDKLSSGTRVHDGTSTAYDWAGFLSPDILPRVVNPDKGFIVAANNKAVP